MSSERDDSTNFSYSGSDASSESSSDGDNDEFSGTMDFSAESSASSVAPQRLPSEVPYFAVGAGGAASALPPILPASQPRPAASLPSHVRIGQLVDPKQCGLVLLLGPLPGKCTMPQMMEILADCMKYPVFLNGLFEVFPPLKLATPTNKKKKKNKQKKKKANTALLPTFAFLRFNCEDTAQSIAAAMSGKQLGQVPHCKLRIPAAQQIRYYNVTAHQLHKLPPVASNRYTGLKARLKQLGQQQHFIVPCCCKNHSRVTGGESPTSQ